MHRFGSTLVCGAALCVLVSPASGQRLDTLQLSLSDAVELTLRSGDEVRIAAAQADLTDAQLTAARAAMLPQLRFTLTQSHVLENARAQAVGQIFNQPNTYNANANLSFAVFQGGRAFGATRVARDARDVAALNEDEVRADATLNVLNAYVQALYADRLVAIRKGGLALVDSQLTQVQEFFEAGRASSYDVLRARVERANMEPTVIDAANSRDIALLQLKRLVNIDAARPLRLTTVIDSGSLAQILADVDRGQEGSSADRASVRAAELNLAGRQSAIGVAKADLFPTLTVTFQTGYQAFPQTGFPTQFGRLGTVACPTTADPSRVCSQQNGGWFSDRTIGTTLSWPIFDGFRTKGNIQAARNQERLAELQLGQQREAVSIQVASARAELERSRSVYGARRENATEAQQAYNLAALRYARGIGTQLEIDDAQLALLTAQTDEARAGFDLYVAAAGVSRSLGRPIILPDSDVRSLGPPAGPSGAGR